MTEETPPLSEQDQFQALMNEECDYMNDERVIASKIVDEVLDDRTPLLADVEAYLDVKAKLAFVRYRQRLIE